MFMKVLIFLGLFIGSVAKHQDKHHAGEANIKTVWKLAKLESQLNNGDNSAAILEKLFAEWGGLFAPTISCLQHTSSSVQNYDLHDVPTANCNEAAMKAWLGVHVKDVTYEDVFADEKGTTVMARCMFQGNLPGGPSARFPAFITYTFDDEGKIISYRSEMDSTPLTPRTRNTQTLWQLNKIMLELNNATYDTALIAKVLPEFEALFTKKVSCATHASSMARSYDLQDVPLSACLVADQKVCPDLHVIFSGFGSVFADDSGTTLLARLDFKGSDHRGSLVQFPIFYTYTFDNAGKIISYSAIMDTSFLPASPPQPGLAEQYAITPSTSSAFLVVFIVAALVASGIAFAISKRRQRDLLLNVYSAI